jgi:undecaprenyl-diphosphatase
MSRGAYNCKIAVACWIAMLIVWILGEFAIRLEPIEQLDRQILEWLAASRTAALDRFFAYVTWAGSNFILLPLILALAVILTIRNHIQQALFLTGSFVGASVLNNVVKHFIARPRPNIFPAVIGIPAGFSFPSSHSIQITAFVLALLLMLILNVSTGARWLILAKALGGSLILLVCISRLYLQVHYPTDVVAGFLTALFWVVGLATLMLPDHQARIIPSHGWRVEKGKQS